jgi:hypothetical protein
MPIRKIARVRDNSSGEDRRAEGMRFIYCRGIGDVCVKRYVVINLAENKYYKQNNAY